MPAYTRRVGESEHDVLTELIEEEDVMKPTPVSATEAKQMLDRGERVAFVDARTPWHGESPSTSCRAPFGFRSTRSINISANSQKTGPSSPTARDRTRHQAPGRRSSSWIAVGRTYATCRAALTRGVGLGTCWMQRSEKRAAAGTRIDGSSIRPRRKIT